jgi:hypothetical protein
MLLSFPFPSLFTKQKNNQGYLFFFFSLLLLLLLFCNVGVSRINFIVGLPFARAERLVPLHPLLLTIHCRSAR